VIGHDELREGIIALHDNMPSLLPHNHKPDSLQHLDTFLP